jgi:hypothetical protein
MVDEAAMNRLGASRPEDSDSRSDSQENDSRPLIGPQAPLALARRQKWKR